MSSPNAGAITARLDRPPMSPHLPLSPLVCSIIADRIERKWQIVAAGCGTAVFGLLFWQSAHAAAAVLILFGVLITSSNNLLSYSSTPIRPSCSRPACALAPSASCIRSVASRPCSQAS